MSYLEFLEQYCIDNGANFEYRGGILCIGNLHGMYYRSARGCDKELYAKKKITQLISKGSKVQNGQA